MGSPAYTRVESVLAKFAAAFFTLMIPNTGSFLAMVPKVICPGIVFLYTFTATMKAMRRPTSTYHLAMMKSLSFTASTVCIGRSAPSWSNIDL